MKNSTPTPAAPAAQTATTETLQQGLDAIRAQIGDAKQKKADRIAMRLVLSAEVEQANFDRGAFVLTHASYNGDAPKTDEAQRSYADNELAISALEKQIAELCTEGGNLKRQQIAAEVSAYHVALAGAEADARTKSDAFLVARDAHILADQRLELLRWNMEMPTAVQMFDSAGRKQFEADLLNAPAVPVAHPQRPSFPMPNAPIAVHAN